MTFGEWMREEREDQHITQTELSYDVRIPQPTLSQYESGKKIPRQDKLERIVNRLGYRLPWQDREKGLFFATFFPSSVPAGR